MHINTYLVFFLWWEPGNWCIDFVFLFDRMKLVTPPLIGCMVYVCKTNEDVSPPRGSVCVCICMYIHCIMVPALALTCPAMYSCVVGHAVCSV